MADGWQMLGQALGGNGEKSYQEGLALGANTQNALAQARARVDENQAKLGLAEALENMNLPADVAAGAATTLRAGGSLGDAIKLALGNQEFGFRAEAAAPGTTHARANQLAQAWGAGVPSDRFQKVGGGYDDRFDDAGIQPLGDAMGREAGGSSAFMQAADFFGMTGPDGRLKDVTGDGVVDDRDRELAFDVMRSTQRVYDEGGVPQLLSGNPYKRPSVATPPPAAPAAPGAAVAPPVAPQAPAAPSTTPLSTPQQVAANAAEIERQKVIGRESGQAYAGLGQAQAAFRNQTTNSDAVIGQIDKALGINDWSSAGPAGALLRQLAFTNAGELQRIVDTIKANTGFQQLQNMRAENATGAGLGQVAVQELMFLQAALGNLDTAQTPEALAVALQNVRQRYGLFREALEQDFQNKVSFATGGAPIPGLPGQGAAPAAPAPAAPGGAMSLQDYIRMKKQGGR